MRRGDPVLLRSVYRGHVRWAFPLRLVSEERGRLALYLAPGTHGVLMERDEEGRYLERWARGDDPRPHVWHTHHILWLVGRTDAHMLGHYWDERWCFRGWYVNLQAPLKEAPLGFDTTDWALDVWIEPDGRWAWKDEADLAEAHELGVFASSEVAEIRAAGERVVAARPWPTGWEDWRAPAGWPPRGLPDHWDRADELLRE